MPESDLRLITDAALQASDIALKYWKTDQRVDHKDGGSPVSEGDFAVDGFLRSMLRAARPDYGWLSEETEDDLARLERRRVFIVDPIDGTRAYIGGERTWAISIAVVEDGAPVAGVVHMPARDRTYAAARGHGATLNGAPLRAGSRAEPDGATVLAAKPALEAKWWAETPPKLDRHWRPSLAYRFCAVAEARFDAVLTIRDAYEWDIAAGILIADEAGAVSSDRNGDPIRFNTEDAKAKGVFSAAPQLHNRLIDLYTGRVAG
ncbi:Inositol monophosphatase family protein [Candidatus Rhodobacter oscarellae]|uniref:Inositol monophosphatase family protein n=1 Tax=Candidatus Rhodobacter oscarellae TaxID=1675527 RepID=A0A0J9H0M1_9RHOB|nr:3'(2'),5'-bisphosphate nucleotidase CysQ [Candidatus Rhodobacter lobularis]KMW59283.1 Inositol monophosphatase family protein [Candidatus Rhodobacter lobularis]